MQEPRRPEAPHPPSGQHQQPSCPPPVQVNPAPIPSKEPPRQHHTHKNPPCREGESILGFFKNLLPRDLDTGDLMIILLLLLMAGDCEKDRNTALLTLALYFFM